PLRETCQSLMEFSVLSHFERLSDDLPRVRELVASIESPNTEDDRLVKFAIVGYSYHRSAEHWSCDELGFLAQRRNEVEDFDQPWVEFVCLASGYLLGLWQAGLCSDAELALLEAQLPGFMWMNSERFTVN